MKNNYAWKELPNVHDLVSVEIDHVDYYGYVDDIDPDWRFPSIKVQFSPHDRAHWFNLSELRPVDFPKNVPRET